MAARAVAAVTLDAGMFVGHLLLIVAGEAGIRIITGGMA
jgi:hypothetical protein